MKRNMRNYLVAAIALVVCSGFAQAQQTEETRRERRMREAEQRAQEAMEELQEALRFMEEAEGAEARRRLDLSIRELQAARSRLGFEGMIAGFAGPQEFLVSSYGGGAPQMGVYLNSDRRPSTDSIGVLVNEVVDGGPSDEAGLEAGDIITVANGESLAREGRRDASPYTKLIQIKEDLEEGDELHVEYRRGATTHEAVIVVRYLDNYATSLRNYVTAIGEINEPDVVVAPRGFSGTISLSGDYVGRLSLLGWLDVELLELNEELGWYFGVSEGLLVVRAPEENNELDLRSGDVIVSVDGRRPSSQTQLTRILRSYEEGESMQIQIMRQREAMTLEVTVPERDNDFFWRPERQ